MVGFPLGAPVSPTPSNTIKFTLNLSCTIICVRNKVIIIIINAVIHKTGSG